MATTASMLNDVHTVLEGLTKGADHATPCDIEEEVKAALVPLKTDSVVLVSHSLGSLTAINMLTGGNALVLDTAFASADMCCLVA